MADPSKKVLVDVDTIARAINGLEQMQRGGQNHWQNCGCDGCEAVTRLRGQLDAAPDSAASEPSWFQDVYDAIAATVTDRLECELAMEAVAHAMHNVPSGDELDDFIREQAAQSVDFALSYEIAQLRHQLEEARLRSIEASNPGIDMGKVRASRDAAPTDQGDDANDPYMTTLHIAQHDTCPECGTQWATTNNTSRIIAIYSRQQDRTTAWHCPDCGMEWDRDTTLEPNPNTPLPAAPTKEPE